MAFRDSICKTLNPAPSTLNAVKLAFITTFVLCGSNGPLDIKADMHDFSVTHVAFHMCGLKSICMYSLIERTQRGGMSMTGNVILHNFFKVSRGKMALDQIRY